MTVRDDRLVASSGARRRERRLRQRGRCARSEQRLAVRGPDVAGAVLVVIGIVVIAGPDKVSVRRRRDRAFRRFKILVHLVVKLLEELVTHGDERGGGIDDEHEKQRDGVPAGQTLPNRESGPPRHGSPSRNTNPTPRTV